MKNFWSAFANLFARMFAPRGDNYKALLMADLGIKR